jgi:enoyl-CoA hydratase/carnithine racemase
VDDHAPMPTLTRERRGPIELVRMDRPAQRNAMDTAMLDELLAALAAAEADESLGALVFSTTDTRALSAGADMAEELTPDAGVARMEQFTRLYAALDEASVATVAVCVGNVVGAGAELAAGCDVRVAGGSLKLAWVGARYGVPVGPGRLVPLVGLSRAKELILTGRVIGAEEAAAIGFVHRVAAADSAEAEALELAAAIAERPRATIAATKRMFRELEATAGRVAYENDLLMAFQREGAGLPRR